MKSGIGPLMRFLISSCRNAPAALSLLQGFAMPFPVLVLTAHTIVIASTESKYTCIAHRYVPKSGYRNPFGAQVCIYIYICIYIYVYVYICIYKSHPTKPTERLRHIGDGHE